MKLLKNTTPCCNAATYIQHQHWPDDSELEHTCKKCGIVYRVTFENVEPLKGCGVFRLVKWKKLTEAGGREMVDDDE